MSDGESVKLKVSEANQGDVGKGIVRVSEEFLDKMGARTLDVVEIIGSRSTAALAVNAYSADQGVDIVRMDGLIRSNAGTSIGQYIEVKKATWSDAKHVTLAPVTQGMQIFAPGDVLTKVFQGRPITKGDVISTTSVRKPPTDSFGRETMFEEIFRGFLGAQAFGLGEIKLRVISTSPGGIVKITEGTEVELLPQAIEVPETARAVSCLRGHRRHQAGHNQGPRDDRAASEAPGALRSLRNRPAQGRPSPRPSGDRQDHARQGSSQRERCLLHLYIRLLVHHLEN